MLILLAMLACSPGSPPDPAAELAVDAAAQAAAEPAAEPDSDPMLVLEPPLAGRPGIDWAIQNHVDIDPGPGVQDSPGTGASYDGHKGTDFRIHGLAAMVEGVAVLAPADGTVLRTRDGEPDRCGLGEKAVVAPDVMCGNGMVIDHGDGFQTQLCHLRQGSVQVQPGDQVTAGQPVGLVGWSGNAEFPHVHLQVRHNRDVLDPFAPVFAGPRAVWRDPSAVPPATHMVWAVGFSDQLDLKTEALMLSPGSPTRISAESDALVGYAMGIVNQDAPSWRLVIDSPSGRRVEADHPPKGRAQGVVWTGRRRLEGQTLEVGTWTARLQVGDGLEQTWSVEVVPGEVPALPPVSRAGCADPG